MATKIKHKAILKPIKQDIELEEFEEFRRSKRKDKKNGRTNRRRANNIRIS